jgi:hypothetical protein
LFVVISLYKEGRVKVILYQPGCTEESGRVHLVILFLPGGPGSSWMVQWPTYFTVRAAIGGGCGLQSSM